MLTEDNDILIHIGWSKDPTENKVSIAEIRGTCIRGKVKPRKRDQKQLWNCGIECSALKS